MCYQTWWTQGKLKVNMILNVNMNVSTQSHWSCSRNQLVQSILSQTKINMTQTCFLPTCWPHSLCLQNRVEFTCCSWAQLLFCFRVSQYQLAWIYWPDLHMITNLDLIQSSFNALQRESNVRLNVCDNKLLYLTKLCRKSFLFWQ